MLRRRSNSFVTTSAPRRASGVGLLVAVALAGGCTSGQAQPDPYASITDEPTTTATPTPSPTATSIYAAPADAYVKPVRPAILDGKPSEAAAIAFAKYYLRMYTYAYLTGDAKELNALGTEGCVFCADVAENIADEYGAGGRDEGGTITIEKASAHDFGVDGKFKVVMLGTQGPSRELDASGTVVVDHPEPRKYEFDFAPRWTASDGWRMVQLGSVSR